MQQNDGGFGRQSGYLTFNAGETSLAGPWYSDNCSPGSPCPGMGAASFLLGLGSYGEADVYAARNADRMGQYSAYLQDDFKMSSRLTLNIGLRYDLLLPVVNKYNQFSWMDPTVMNTTYHVLGAMVFATPERRTGASTFTKGFGPRIGLAYALGNKTVLRSGYGILYTTGGAERSNRGCCSQGGFNRSEEHTSELQSPCNLVCRLLLEKKNTHRRRNDLGFSANGLRRRRRTPGRLRPPAGRRT